MKVSNMKVISKVSDRLDGLTEGKEYRVYSVKQERGCHCPLFMIYNDRENWVYIKSCLFKPVEE